VALHRHGGEFMTAAPPEGVTFRGQPRPLIVKKFGGTSVADVDRIRGVARRALASQRAGHDVVVVVSAMSGETDRLLSLARQVLPLPDGREQDVVVATGEQVSVALTAMAIQAEGGHACSFLGYQLPLVTDSSHTRARIQHVELGPVCEALARGQIAVVAGFQGVDASMNVTTLGRGGSDTTAVALAAVLGAQVCEIYTDVDGVYTADPRVCPSSRKLPEVAYEEMLELSSLGAKVLQVRSVEIAMKYNVPVHVRSSFADGEGTYIVHRQRVLEDRVLTGLACARNQVRIDLVGLKQQDCLIAELTEFLAEQNVCVDMLRQMESGAEPGRLDVAFSIDDGDLRRARSRLEQFAARLGARDVRLSSGLAKVSLVGIGMQSDPTIAARVCRSLTQHGISVVDLALNELRMTCLVNEGAADDAIRVLHDAFGLSPTAPASRKIQA